MQEEEQEKGFHVRDRRIHHGADEAGAEAAGEAVPERERGAPEPASEAATEPVAGAAPEAAPEDADAEAARHREAEQGFSLGAEGPPIDFSAFVFSLARNALIHLGLEPHPETGQQQIHLDAARETIDVLGMLEDKTRGNLTPEEGELISKMLYTLRLSFVEVSRAGRPAE